MITSRTIFFRLLSLCPFFFLFYIHTTWSVRSGFFSNWLDVWEWESKGWKTKKQDNLFFLRAYERSLRPPYVYASVLSLVVAAAALVGPFCDCHVKEEMDFAGTIRKKLRGWAAPSFSFFLRPAAFKGSGYIRILRLSLLLSQAGVCSFEVGSEEEGKEKKQSKKPIYLFSMPASH